MRRVEGTVALVTGAARGQGRSHCVRLAEEGASIIAVDLCGQIDSVPYPMATPADLDETVALVQAAGGEIAAFEADVRSFSELESAVDAGVDRFGRLDIVAANAGIITVHPALEIPEQDWDDVMDVNVKGVWLTAKAALPHMIRRGGGSIVITSSDAGTHGMENLAHYCSSKHAVVGLMRVLAREMGKHNIRVNTIHPSSVDTDMIQNEKMYRLFCPDLESPGRDDVAPIHQSRMLLPTPWLSPRDISEAVLWLASDEARFVTGTTLAVDAGTGELGG